MIEWQVTNEVNFSHYEKETSYDGSSFSTLGIAAATSNSIYSYLHSHPIAGINYYRLKMVDIDGNGSNIVTLPEVNGISKECICLELIVV